jgi:hypothetical protein
VGVDVLMRSIGEWIWRRLGLYDQFIVFPAVLMCNLDALVFFLDPRWVIFQASLFCPPVVLNLEPMVYSFSCVQHRSPWISRKNFQFPLIRNFFSD